MARILLIDDDDLVRATVTQLLQRSGHEVEIARNGVEGMRRFAAGSFDLVIADIIMPEQEGIETIIQIRRVNPHVGVIAISGGGRSRNMNFLDEAMALGADATLKKPFSKMQLLTTVNLTLAKGTGAARGAGC